MKTKYYIPPIEEYNKKTILIYTLSCPITKEVRYVGKTNTDLNLRYNNHINKSKNKKTHKDCWIQSLLEKRLKPVVEILEKCDKENWINREQYWIEQMKAWGLDLVNHTIGGEGHSGIKKGSMSKEQKKKISQSKKGIRTNIIIFTPEVKEKISQSKRKKVLQYDLEKNYIQEFDSISEAANSIGLSISAISKTLKNEKYTAGGYRWKVKSI